MGSKIFDDFERSRKLKVPLPKRKPITLGRVLLALLLATLIFGAFVSLPFAILWQVEDMRIIIRNHIAG